MPNKIRLGVLGLFLTVFGVLEIITFLTPAMLCDSRVAAYHALAGRLAVTFLLLVGVAALDVLVSWRHRRIWAHDPDALEARARKLRESRKAPQAAGPAVSPTQTPQSPSAT